MPTYIDGIGSSQALDTAGEVVDLMGLDCSSLVGGPFNWEHKADVPAQIVGKVLKCKKIFEESDCEDDRQKMYWDACQVPFLYVMGRLFDDKKESAKEVAALFLDDAENPNEQPMVGFSIEGSKINKSGMTVTHSIARKVTITNCPANKTCIAKLIPNESSKPKDDLESIFKSESYTEIDLQKTINQFNDLQKAGNLSLVGNKGNKIGQTSSGKEIHSHAKIHEYPHFSAQDHHEAMNTHMEAAGKTSDFKTKQFHADKAKLHMSRRDTLQRLANSKRSQKDSIKTNILSAKTPSKTSTPASASNTQRTNASTVFHPEKSGKVDYKKPTMKKAMEAGSGMAAPSELSGGAALSRESILIPKKKKHSKWLLRAEQEFNSWAKKEEFRSFMQDKLPHLTITEIDAIGKTMILNKSWSEEVEFSKKIKK